MGKTIVLFPEAAFGPAPLRAARRARRDVWRTSDDIRVQQTHVLEAYRPLGGRGGPRSRSAPGHRPRLRPAASPPDVDRRGHGGRLVRHGRRGGQDHRGEGPPHPDQRDPGGWDEQPAGRRRQAGRARVGAAAVRQGRGGRRGSLHGEVPGHPHDRRKLQRQLPARDGRGRHRGAEHSRADELRAADPGRGRPGRGERRVDVPQDPGLLQHELRRHQGQGRPGPAHRLSRDRRQPEGPAHRFRLHQYRPAGGRGS